MADSLLFFMSRPSRLSLRVRRASPSSQRSFGRSICDGAPRASRSRVHRARLSSFHHIAMDFLTLNAAVHAAAHGWQCFCSMMGSCAMELIQSQLSRARPLPLSSRAPSCHVLAAVLARLANTAANTAANTPLADVLAR